MNINSPEYKIDKDFISDKSIPLRKSHKHSYVSVYLNQHPDDYNNGNFLTQEFTVSFPEIKMSGNEFIKIVNYISSLGIYPDDIDLKYENGCNFTIQVAIPAQE